MNAAIPCVASRGRLLCTTREPDDDADEEAKDEDEDEAAAGTGAEVVGALCGGGGGVPLATQRFLMDPELASRVSKWPKDRPSVVTGSGSTAERGTAALRALLLLRPPPVLLAHLRRHWRAAAATFSAVPPRPIEILHERLTWVGFCSPPRGFGFVLTPTVT